MFKHWIVLLTGALVGVMAGLAVTAASSAMYQASSSVYFSLSSSRSATDLNQGSTYIQGQMVSIAQLATSAVVLNPVIEELQLFTTPRRLASRVSASVPPDSVIVELTVESSSAEEAADIANAIGEELVSSVERVGPEPGTDQISLSGQIIETAVAPDEPSSPDGSANLAAGGLLGSLLGILCAAVLEQTNSCVRRPEDLNDPSLRSWVVRGKWSFATWDHQEFRVDDLLEDHRRLALGLLPRGTTPLVLTLASVAGNPLSSVSWNLAGALSEYDLRVLIISGSDPFALKQPGDPLTRGSESGQEYGAQKSTPSGVQFDVLSVTSAQDDGARGLSPGRIESLLTASIESYDVVLIQALPMDRSSEALQAASKSDAMLLIIESGRVSRQEVIGASRYVSDAKVALAGVVFVSN